MNWKKLLLLVGMIAVVAAVGYAIYTIFFAPPEEVLPPEEEIIIDEITGLPIARPGVPPEVAPPEELPPEIIPVVSEIAEGGLTTVEPLVSAPTTGVAMSATGEVSYYNRADGKFYRINRDGTIGQLSEKEFYNVSDATFDPYGDKAILEYPDGSNVMYDFTTGTQVTLPKHWEEFGFDARGDSIVAKSIGIDESNRFLIVSSPDGSGARAVQELGANADKVKVAWSPSNQIIATSETGKSLGLTAREVYFLGQYHENFKSMIIEGLDFRPKWNPTGQQLLYSTASADNDYKPTLWVVDAAGDDIGRNRRTLNVDTWADKCTFQDTSTLYCAVPQETFRGLGLQPSMGEDIPDNIYRIDIDTGLQTLIAVPEGRHTVGQIMLAPDGSRLYFTDQATGVINEIKLK